ncbi:hypothetical protein AA313_de0201018 [Arthrobotrys entomopaga]|nr:hypothetical protein AA313_de0201018 [Arthrobotrys entomopaga]
MHFAVTLVLILGLTNALALPKPDDIKVDSGLVEDASSHTINSDPLGSSDSTSLSSDSTSSTTSTDTTSSTTTNTESSSDSDTISTSNSDIITTSSDSTTALSTTSDSISSTSTLSSDVPIATASSSTTFTTSVDLSPCTKLIYHWVFPNFGGVETVHTATVSSTWSVDCSPCTNVAVTTVPIPPALSLQFLKYRTWMSKTTTITIPVTKAEYQYACRTTSVQ